jgi:hypothetical protein
MKKRTRGRGKMTKTNKTAIGTVGRGKQKLLIFEKKYVKMCLFIYLFIHLWLAVGAY